MPSLRSITALGLSAALAASLCACGGSAPASSAPEETAAAETAAAELTSDTPVLYVDAQPACYDEYLCYLYQALLTATQNDSSLTWESEINDESLAQYVKEQALQSLLNYRAIEMIAVDYNVSLSDSNEASMESLYDDTLQYFDSEDAMSQYLTDNFCTWDLYYYTNYCAALYYDDVDQIYLQTNENAPSEDELASYIEENGYYCFADIYFASVDTETYEALDDDTIAEKESQAEECYSRVQAGESLFDLMDEYSDADSNQGYFARPGSIDSSLEDSILALDIGGTALVQTDDGWYIVQRMDVDYNTFWQTAYCYIKMNELVEQYADGLQVAYTDAYMSIDPEAIFGEL